MMVEPKQRELSRINQSTSLRRGSHLPEVNGSLAVEATPHLDSSSSGPRGEGVLNQVQLPAKSIPTIRLGSVFLLDGGKKRLNIFTSLMFIHLAPRKSLKSDSLQSPTTPRRVLLDTGADFNLISFSAHAELGLSKQPYHGHVHSIGGCTELKSAIDLRWHFWRYNPDPKDTLRPYSASFIILPPESEARFDCILGRPWIEENWAEFVSLVELNRQKEIG